MTLSAFCSFVSNAVWLEKLEKSREKTKNENNSSQVA